MEHPTDSHRHSHSGSPADDAGRPGRTDDAGRPGGTDDAARPGGTPSNAQLWDGIYSSRPRMWSGHPNAQLLAEASGIAPGRALDLGCGEGADAIWLALRGWSVTGVDVSAVALERAASHAVEAGCEIEWILQDLTEWIPQQQYDLVTAQFLHSDAAPWQDALQPAAAAVRPGGTLLIVGHHPDGLPAGGSHGPRDRFFTAEQAAHQLGIGGPDWKVEVMDVRGRRTTGPDGQEAAVADAVLRARRLTRS